MDEEKIKQQVKGLLSNDFEIKEEITGNHLVEQDVVIIDFMIFPKPHLINQGFEAFWVGIECKYIKPNSEHANKKLNKLIWQSISYAHSVFNIDKQLIRPRFVLIAFNREEINASDRTNITWRTLINFAQYANVGVLSTVSGGWGMSFGTGNHWYYRTNKGRGNHNVIRRQVGNCA